MQIFITSFIQIDHVGAFNKLTAEMNIFYESNVQFIYAPQPDMICAVLNGQDWCRARIVRILPNAMCELWLVDRASISTISWQHIRFLDSRFVKIDECVSQCKLRNIEPIDGDVGWTKAALAEFMRIAHSSNLFVNVREKILRTSCVLMYIVRSSSEINVNGMLVHQKHAKRTGSSPLQVEQNNSLNDDAISDISSVRIVVPSAKKKKGSRTDIHVLHIISPGEFYITLDKYLAGIDQMRSNIQNQMNNQIVEVDVQWKVGDHCVALTVAGETTSTNRFWYRGTVVMVKDNECFVFLRDRGEIVSVLTKHMAAIDTNFDRVRDGAIRCHLACVQPTGNQKKWSQSSIAEFRASVTQYHGLAVSLQGQPIGDSMSVLLWGKKKRCDDPLLSHFFEWYNINELLVNSGFFHMTERFKSIGNADIEGELYSSEDGFDEWLNKMFEAIIHKSPDSELDVHSIDMDYGICPGIFNEMEDSETKSWPPAIPINKHAFVGIPTYVDNNAVIYLHDSCEKPLLDKIKRNVNEKYFGSKMDSTKVWKVNDACVAQYHLDHLFYRAIILRIVSTEIFKVILDFEVLDQIINEL